MENLISQFFDELLLVAVLRQSSQCSVSYSVTLQPGV